MARRKESLLEGLVDLAARLPWQAGVALALLSYLGFHYAASLPLLPVVASDPKALGNSLGPSLGRQVVVSLAGVLQYLVPLALLLGAGISVFRGRRQRELHQALVADPTQDALNRLSWRDFEHLTAESFRQQGYRVVMRGGDGPDGGVDIELHQGQDKYLVQCKQWKATKVGVAIVRELYGVMAAERAVGGFVVASGAFTEEAQRFAEGRAIRLVPSGTLLAMIQKNAGQAAPVDEPVGQAVTCPQCGSPMVPRVAQKGSRAGSKFWGCRRFPACRGVRG
jgi:restriction system protein